MEPPGAPGRFKRRLSRDWPARVSGAKLSKSATQNGPKLESGSANCPASGSRAPIELHRRSCAPLTIRQHLVYVPTQSAHSLQASVVRNCEVLERSNQRAVELPEGEHVVRGECLWQHAHVNGGGHRRHLLAQPSSRGLDCANPSAQTLGVQVDHAGEHVPLQPILHTLMVPETRWAATVLRRAPSALTKRYRGSAVAARIRPLDSRSRFSPRRTRR